MMKSTTFLLLLALSLVSCGKSGSSSSDTAAEVSEINLSEDDVQAPTVPDAAITFKTNIDLMNLTSSQENKMERAIEVVKMVVVTEEFRSKILNHKYKGKKTFVDNGGLTNAQIYKKILEGAETLSPAKNNRMDMEVEMYSASNNVVGYTYPNSKRIWVNTKFFNSYTPAGVAHNLVHEWLHKLGFKHSASANAARPYSVPYAIGYIVMEMGKDFL